MSRGKHDCERITETSSDNSTINTTVDLTSVSSTTTHIMFVPPNSTKKPAYTQCRRERATRVNIGRGNYSTIPSSRTRGSR